MVKKMGRKKLFIVLAVVLALLVIAISTLVIKSFATSTPSEAPSSTTETKPSVSETAGSTDRTPATSEEAKEEPEINPELVSTVVIEPMALSVPYLKAAGGFSFVVLRAAGGTQYVQFSSPSLIGTKCTNDEGVFATIIEAPSSDEALTLAKTVSVDGTTYGLSLADTTCTADTELLKQYQEAFSQPFASLKKM